MRISTLRLTHYLTLSTLPIVLPPSPHLLPPYLPCSLHFFLLLLLPSCSFIIYLIPLLSSGTLSSSQFFFFCCPNISCFFFCRFICLFFLSLRYFPYMISVAVSLTSHLSYTFQISLYLSSYLTFNFLHRHPIHSIPIFLPHPFHTGTLLPLTLLSTTFSFLCSSFTPFDPYALRTFHPSI